MKKNSQNGIKRIIRAFGHSFDGIVETFKSESAFRQDIILCVLAAVFQCFLDLPILFRILMLASLPLIVVAELVNTAIETTIDRISPEKNPLSKKAKDIGSAVVLITISLVAVLWISLIAIA